MCQSAITLITNALPTVDNDERLLKIKGVVALFVQTMDVSNKHLSSLDGTADELTGLGLLGDKSGAPPSDPL